MSRRQIRVLLIEGIIVGAAVGPALVAYLNSGVEISNGSGLHVRAPNGPDINATQVNRFDADVLDPNPNTVRFVTDSGNIKKF